MAWELFHNPPTSLSPVRVIRTNPALAQPEGPNPMKELLQGKMALVIMAAFGVGVATLCEELAFRGFVQPLLVPR